MARILIIIKIKQKIERKLNVCIRNKKLISLICKEFLLINKEKNQQSSSLMSGDCEETKHRKADTGRSSIHRKIFKK